jgi:hypothetical protein
MGGSLDTQRGQQGKRFSCGGCGCCEPSSGEKASAIERLVRERSMSPPLSSKAISFCRYCERYRLPQLVRRLHAFVERKHSQVTKRTLLAYFHGGREPCELPPPFSWPAGVPPGSDDLLDDDELERAWYRANANARDFDKFSDLRLKCEAQRRVHRLRAEIERIEERRLRLLDGSRILHVQNGNGRSMSPQQQRRASGSRALQRAALMGNPEAQQLLRERLQQLADQDGQTSPEERLRTKAVLSRENAEMTRRILELETAAELRADETWTKRMRAKQEKLAKHRGIDLDAQGAGPARTVGPALARSAAESSDE